MSATTALEIPTFQYDDEQCSRLDGSENLKHFTDSLQHFRLLELLHNFLQYVLAIVQTINKVNYSRVS